MNGVSSEIAYNVMAQQQSAYSDVSVLPIRPTHLLVNYMKEEIESGNIALPLKLPYGKCACHSCQANAPVFCAFADVSCDFI